MCATSRVHFVHLDLSKLCVLLASPFIRAVRLYYVSHSRKCEGSRKVQLDETIKPWWLMSGAMWFCLLTGPRSSA